MYVLSMSSLMNHFHTKNHSDAETVCLQPISKDILLYIIFILLLVIYFSISDTIDLIFYFNLKKNKTHWYIIIYKL